MKRSSECLDRSSKRVRLLPKEITYEALDEWMDKFNDDESNIIARNAVVSAGVQFALTNSVEANKVSHIFLNTVKGEDVKATNQESSGRCWMFAAGNMFRHNVIRAIGTKNFEFSKTYWFFYDKLERANYFLLETIKTRDLPSDDRYIQHIFDDCMEDGGWWNVIANIIDKYGAVPIDAMPETYQSKPSSEMNDVLTLRLHAAAINIRKMRTPKQETMNEIRVTTVRQIYDILVKFLGEPPNKFAWSFYTDEYNGQIISGHNPTSFKEMMLPDTSLSEDFVVLSNYPQKKYGQTYKLRYSTYVEGGKPYICLNLPIYELKKYAKKMLLSGSGHAVWFAGDISTGMHYGKSAFNDKLFEIGRASCRERG